MSTKKLASNVEWQSWGRIDPLFGAASWPGKKRSEGGRWTDREFYKLGEMDWRDFVEHWERYGFDNESCVEIGCGPGRITAQLVKTFKIVRAVDVAKESIDYARKRISDSSVTFYLASGLELPLDNESVSTAFSCHVFQHFDSPEVGRLQFAEIYRVLKECGTFMVHLPIHTWPTDEIAFRLLYRTRQTLSDLIARVKRMMVARGLLSTPLMRGSSYELDWLVRELSTIGFQDIEVMIFPTLSNGHLHSFVLGRKVERASDGSDGVRGLVSSR